MIDWLNKGGPVLYLLLGCSLLLWVLVIERLIWHFKIGGRLEKFHVQALNSLLKDDMGGLVALCNNYMDLPTARLLRIAIEQLSSTHAKIRSQWKQSVERQRQWILQDLKKYLWLIGTIASAAPFIGLFGTVVGILQSFAEIGRTGQTGFDVVASGISEALIATAIGILVGIVAVFAYNGFLNRTNRIAVLVRIQIEELIQTIAQNQGGSTS